VTICTGHALEAPQPERQLRIPAKLNGNSDDVERCRRRGA
jgi:hypothetical protein